MVQQLLLTLFQICSKFELFFTFQGSTVTYLKCGWNHYMAFVANEILFPVVKEFQKLLRFYKVKDNIS